MRRTRLGTRRNIVGDDVKLQDGRMAELQDGSTAELERGDGGGTPAELKAILEALIFASPEPLTPKAMFKLLDAEPKEEVQAALTALKQDYERAGGLQLVILLERGEG